MTTQLGLNRDAQGIPIYAPNFATNHFSATLVNGSEQTFTVPGDSLEWIASFSYQPGATVWISNNTTAAIPAGATFASTNSELNPGARRVKSGDIIHCVTSNLSTDVGVSLYTLPKGS